MVLSFTFCTRWNRRALEKTHTRSAPSLGGSHKAALETKPMNQNQNQDRLYRYQNPRVLRSTQKIIQCLFG